MKKRLTPFMALGLISFQRSLARSISGLVLLTICISTFLSNDAFSDECAPVQMWYPDCDGDGAFGFTADISACDEIAALADNTSCSGNSNGGFPFDVTTNAPGNADCDDTDPNFVSEQTWWFDCDGDGYYQPVANVCNPTNDEGDCSDGEAPDAFSTINPGSVTDCDDNNPFRSPGTTEICDGIDNNCDGFIDEGCGSYDLYRCGGATFASGYTVHVDLEAPWTGVAFQAEDDVDGTCKDKKADGFACTGSGNLITARIDDAVSFRDFDDSVDNYTLDLAVSAAGDPAYVVIHAEIFDPAGCATPIECNFDDFDQGGDSELADDTCYDSGYSGGDSADGSGYFNDAKAACAETFEYTGEGMIAEGEPFSPNRPKIGDSPNRNWAMFVELAASCREALLSVPAGEPAPTCDSATLTVDAVADGGDFDADYIDVGDVIFTPDSDCAAVLVCEDSLSTTVCILDD
jgi:hypothetical protein